MLSKTSRIGSAARISYLLEKGQRVRSLFFQFRISPNTAGHHRFSLVLSKNLSRKAVPRNLLRRRVYEAIRKNLALHLPSPGKPCYDVVVLCSPQIKNLGFDAIEKDIRRALNKLSGGTDMVSSQRVRV